MKHFMLVLLAFCSLTSTVHAQGYIIETPPPMQSLDDANLFLPDLDIKGHLPSLHDAMNKDPRLKSLVDAFTKNAADQEQISSLTSNILDQWGGNGPLKAADDIPHGNFLTNMAGTQLLATGEKCDAICQLYMTGIWTQIHQRLEGILALEGPFKNLKPLYSENVSDWHEWVINLLTNAGDPLDNNIGASLLLWAVEAKDHSTPESIFKGIDGNEYQWKDALSMISAGINVKRKHDTLIAVSNINPQGTKWFWTPKHSSVMTYDTMEANQADAIKNLSFRDSITIDGMSHDAWILRGAGYTLITMYGHTLQMNSGGMVQQLVFNDKIIDLKQKVEEIAPNGIEFNFLSFLASIQRFF